MSSSSSCQSCVALQAQQLILKPINMSSLMARLTYNVRHTPLEGVYCLEMSPLHDSLPFEILISAVPGVLPGFGIRARQVRESEREREQTIV